MTSPGSMAFDEMSREMEGLLQKAKEQLSAAGIREARAELASIDKLRCMKFKACTSLALPFSP